MEKSRNKLPELAKSKNPDDKSVKEGLKNSFLVGSVENSKENGVRVSSNGEEDLVGDDLEAGVVSVVKKTKVVETEISVKSGGDSETVQGLLSFNDAKNEEVGHCVGVNDGISLLVDVSSGMGREDGGAFYGREDGCSSNAKVENPDGKIREMSDSEDGEEDDSSDGDYEFCVGDFVWGKIKSYPWWPGQIYDSSDASDYALKVKRRDRLLVAYFDGTFAWCHPSQLKPFEKNFEEMSAQSSTKSFVNAVWNAVDKIGRLVELKMTCSCVPKESLAGLARPLAANSGVKPGVLVPEGGIAKLWNYLFGPSECLAELKHVARVISVNNMLEFTELKCWLSTFYRVGGGYQLPLYHEPQPIAGLENSHNMALEFIHDAEGPVKGPIEEETNQSLLQKCLMGSDNGQRLRRKQKSIAEIMEGYVDTPAKNVEEDVTKEETIPGNPLQSSLRKKTKGNDEANGGTSLSSRPKRRKVTKLLESTSATGIGISTVERDGSKAKEKMRKFLLSRRKSKASHTESEDGSKAETNASPSSVEKETVPREDGEATEQIEKSFLSRERKRSKYLSPPYTNINRRQTKKNFKAEFLKVSGEARLAEQMTRAAANLIESESPAILMCSDEVLQKKETKQVGAGHEKPDTSNPETMKLDQSTVIDAIKVKASAKDVLSGIRSTAINLNSLKKDSLDVVEGFVWIFRSSVYCSGPNYKIYNKSWLGRKRKTRDSEPMSSEKYQNQTERKSPEERSRWTKIKKNEEAKPMKDDKRKSDEPILKQAGDMKTKSRGSDGKEKSDKHKLKQADAKTKGRGTDGKEKSDKHKLKRARGVKTKGRGTEGKEKSEKPKLRQVGDVKTKGRGTDGKEKSDKRKVGQITRSQDKKRKDIESDGKEKSNMPKLGQVTMSQEKKRKDSESDGKAVPDNNAKDKQTDGKASPTSLFVTFGLTSSLPSKNDLIKIYNKFGSLNEEETEMFYDSCCAQVVFLRSSDAEEAIKSSQLASPFGDSNCNFEIRDSSSAYNMQKLEGISNAKPSPVKEGGQTLGNESGSKISVGEASSLDYVKLKLEMIGSVLANSDGKISPELKSIVEGEVNDLLEKVNKVAGSSVS